MSVEFRLETTGAQAIERSLAGLVTKFGDIEPLMTDIGVYLESATIERFDNETAPDGSRWTPSARAKRDSGKTLTDTAQLRSSITSEASGSSVAVGTNKIYARIHQLGFDGTIQVKGHKRTIHEAFGRSLKAPVTFDVDPFERLLNMPARPFLGLSAEDETEILAQVEDYARDAVGGAL